MGKNFRNENKLIFNEEKTEIFLQQMQKLIWNALVNTFMTEVDSEY